MKQPYFIVITGPTATGKTDLVLSLAEKLPIEIVNGDMGQMYEQLTIGTAKPDWKQHPIPHHLFDIIDNPEDFSVTQYRELLLKTFQDIWKRKKIPVVVGGSAFYIKSIFFPPSARTDEEYDETASDKSLWDRLNEIDPERAQKIHENDVYRLKRALAIWQQTGKKPSTQQQIYSPPSSYACFFVTRDKEELNKRVDERVVEMMNHGWLQEVEKLKNTDWEPFLKRKKIIGYELLLEYLNDENNLSKDTVIELIKQRTRKYAKRQITFFNMLEKELMNAMSSSDRSIIQRAATISLSAINAKDAVDTLIAALK